MSRARKILLGLAGMLAITALLCASVFVCLPALVMHGVAVNECPDGELRQTLRAEAWGLRREGVGTVQLTPVAHYTTGAADEHRTTTAGGLSAELSLVDASGASTPLRPEDGWDERGDTLVCDLKLPAVPDGDYKLHIEGRSRLGPVSADLPLGIYAPAAVHVLTDRPLYEPGNVVRMRALALRARDLTPIDARPGRWTLTDPTGEVVLDERAPTGAWGVAAGDFPLDRGAPIGTWTLAWVSGEDRGEARFQVEPFTLPRFRVEARSERPAWHMGEQPVIAGSVVYSSGAPVGGAALELRWGTSSGWPLPSAWTDPSAPADQRLPTTLSADAAGRFRATLPVVPGDLQGLVTLSAQITATDPTGEALATSLSLLLAEERIQASAVTELDGGLVESYSNRLYVRVTTPWGAPLPETSVQVSRAWDPTVKPVRTTTDVDGVAELQIDPGPAVNVVIPAPPYRPPVAPPAVRRGTPAEELFGGDVTLDDLTALERWEEAVTGCAIRAPDESEVSVETVARVGPDGAVRSVWAPEGPLGDCMRAALLGQRLASGGERLMRVPWSLRPPAAPWLELSEARGWPEVPDGLEEAFSEAAILARACLPRDASWSDGGVLEWSARAGSAAVQARWHGPEDAPMDPSSQRCLRDSLSAATLPEPAEADAFGALSIALEQPTPPDGGARPSPTIFQGYELKITATSGAATIGSTLLRLPPGAIPDLRLRPTPLLPRPGDTVTVDVLRGPNYAADLPTRLFLVHQTRGSIEAEVDKKTGEARFKLPDDAQGWYEVSWGGALARVFVRDTSALAVTVEPEQARYAPGQAARLRVQTLRDGAGVAAAVGLFGVDESLGQLVPLPGADALDSLRPSPLTPAPAFGALDGAALAMGRIRGEAAAAATLLRVISIPSPAELDRSINASLEDPYDPTGPLVESFYAVLSELHRLTRDWEQRAPETEKMSPATMARLWSEAVEAAHAANQPWTDAWGRPLRLRHLPYDLLAQTDPREVVLDGTRLPEDIESWPAWVAKERP